jgi:hypothetical protein
VTNESQVPRSDRMVKEVNVEAAVAFPRPKARVWDSIRVVFAAVGGMLRALLRVRIASHPW